MVAFLIILMIAIFVGALAFGDKSEQIEPSQAEMQGEELTANRAELDPLDLLLRYGRQSDAERLIDQGYGEQLHGLGWRGGDDSES
jgi:hypothetical protein